MRRVWAMLLMVAFSLPLIAPALISFDPNSKLPACCRHQGVHHCALAANPASPSGPWVAAGRCLLFPGTHATPATWPAGILPAVPVVAGLRPHRFAPASRETAFLLSYSRAGQQRGPPTPLS